VAEEARSAGAPFGQMLRHYRRARGLTQEELAERAGVSARTVSDLERGVTGRPYWQTVGALAAAVGLQGAERDEFVACSRRGWRSAAPGGQADPGQPGGRAPARTGAARPDRMTALRQLPAAVSHFTGRAAELDALTGLLSEASEMSTVVISALAGTAGVGKTALAVHRAHRVAGRFPDGQLYVNLRGYDPGAPVSPADALAGFLGALGVPGAQIPDGQDERSGLYRSMLAGRRVLVVLDNARDSDQVRPLLPGDPACAAVVTSRDALAGLVVADGARRLDLDVLPPAESAALLRALIGARAGADPEVLAELAGLCAGLPLALRIAAELAASRPRVPLAGLVSELRAARLDYLDAGDDHADVRAVFSWSVRQLTDDVAGAFALLGLHPGEDLDADATAALTGTTPAKARRLLSRLHRASLLQARSPGRYGMHDLLRAYAREQAAARDPGGQCDQALTRLFDYYVAAAAAGMDVLVPAETHRRPRVAATTTALPDMPNEAGARAWLDAELANLVAVVARSAGHGRPRYAAALAGTLYRYLLMSGHLPEAQIIYGHALRAARQSADLAAEAAALNGLGSVASVKGRFSDAVGLFEAALDCYRRCGDRAGEARLLGNLGTTEQRLHNHHVAAHYLRQAVIASQDAGDTLGVARALVELADSETEMGSRDQAADHLHRALPVLREARDPVGEAQALSRMGELSLASGQLTQAAGHFEQSLAIFRRIDHPAGVAAELCNLGDVSFGQGNYQQAVSYQRQAFAWFRQAGSQYGEIQALRRLGAALKQAGQPAAAHTELETAFQLAAESDNTYEVAGAHGDLADIHHQAGDDDQARRHWQQALDLYTQLGASDADQIRSRLSDLQAGTPH
jgi:tetratricopeptide (TPR) repeat protein/DNA-binding XRE family transcriptional regulator